MVTLGLTLIFDTSVAKGLILKVKRFWGLIPAFMEVTEQTLLGCLLPLPSSISPLS